MNKNLKATLAIIATICFCLGVYTWFAGLPGRGTVKETWGIVRMAVTIGFGVIMAVLFWGEFVYVGATEDYRKAQEGRRKVHLSVYVPWRRDWGVSEEKLQRAGDILEDWRPLREYFELFGASEKDAYRYYASFMAQRSIDEMHDEESGDYYQVTWGMYYGGKGNYLPRFLTSLFLGNFSLLLYPPKFSKIRRFSTFHRLDGGRLLRLQLNRICKKLLSQAFGLFCLLAAVASVGLAPWIFMAKQKGPFVLGFIGAAVLTVVFFLLHRKSPLWFMDADFRRISRGQFNVFEVTKVADRHATLLPLEETVGDYVHTLRVVAMYSE